MGSKYQERQRAKLIGLINSGDAIFYGSQSGAIFMGKSREFVLIDNNKNLYEPIYKEVIEYFQQNHIAWWGGIKPTGHILSSQIACINHLFQIRNDKLSVLSLLSTISKDFVDVLPIGSDKYSHAFIQFEAVSDNDNLNEGIPTRGSNCTSIDALIYAVHYDGSNWLIPIEWKYTEFYNNQNKATEGCKKDPDNCKGEVRKKRYSDLITNSHQLKSNDHTCFYYEPFYQLMRQTLWAEEMIKNNKQETLKATNYLHLHVIPEGNEDLLNKKYSCSNLGLEETWRKYLTDQSKYLIVSPEKLLSEVDADKYKKLLNYLGKRYW